MNYSLSTLGLVLLLLTGSCSKKEQSLAPIPFSDDFSRSDLGEFWNAEWGWSIKDGELFTSGTNNEQPLWLSARLPADAVIEFDVHSESPAGDIKFEIYGDGEKHASGYILIMGGWNNTISCIARLNEHGSDRQEKPHPAAVQIGKRYHMKVIRKDKLLRWLVDDKMLLDYFDSDPLRGEGHDRFAFNSWQSHLYFDNLRIRAATAEDK